MQHLKKAANRRRSDLSVPRTFHSTYAVVMHQFHFFSFAISRTALNESGDSRGHLKSEGMNLEAAGFAIGPPKTDHFSFTGWVIYRRETWEWCYSGILNCTLFDTTPLITIYSVDKREVRVLVNSHSIVIQACFILVFVKHWLSW